MRLAPALLALIVAACGTADTAQQAAQARHDGRTLDEWWSRRRDPNDASAVEARAAIRAMGPTAVPFLAAKAASRDLGDNIGGSSLLEDLCPNALRAMEESREAYPSPALEAAIRLVRGDSARRIRTGACTADGPPTTAPAAGSPAGGEAPR